MSIDAIKERLPEYAKDIRLNISSVLGEAGSPGLSANQIAFVALACAYATKSRPLIQGISGFSEEFLDEAAVNAAKAAATIMGMNNVYYRFLHLVGDPEYRSMRAGLRMQVIATPGVAKVDFELASLAVSSINGCGSCIGSHANTVAQAGIEKQGVQSAVKIAAVINAAAQAFAIETAAEVAL